MGKLVKGISALIWNYRNRKYWKQQSKGLTNKDFTILSCNCIGGIVYHNLSLPFRSPTVNLFLSCEDFIRLCEDPKRYLAAEFLPYEGAQKENYPMATVDGLVLHLVHYPSFQKAKEAWERRCARVNYENLLLVATDRDGFTPELSARFDALSYQKVLFTHQKDENPNHYYIPGYENQTQVGDITKKTTPNGGRRIMDQFDWIRFLNRNEYK